MKKEEFFNKLKKELELDDNEINQSSSLHLTSLMTLALISFLDEHFGLRVKAIDLTGIDSVDKLVNIIGKDKFE
jgi:acyl carrier protein